MAYFAVGGVGPKRHLSPRRTLLPGTAVWGTSCHRCDAPLFEPSEAGWCCICGRGVCDSCADAVEYRVHRRLAAGKLRRSIGRPTMWTRWMRATWGLVLRGRPCAPGWRMRPVNVCSETSCAKQFAAAQKRLEEHGIELRGDDFW